MNDVFEYDYDIHSRLNKSEFLDTLSMDGGTWKEVEEVLEEMRTVNNPENYIIFKDIIERMGPDAREVAELLFDVPVGLMEKVQVKKGSLFLLKTHIRDYLENERGWSKLKVRRAFIEIKISLQESENMCYNERKGKGVSPWEEFLLKPIIKRRVRAMAKKDVNLKEIRKHAKIMGVKMQGKKSEQILKDVMDAVKDKLSPDVAGKPTQNIDWAKENLETIEYYNQYSAKAKAAGNGGLDEAKAKAAEAKVKAKEKAAETKKTAKDRKPKEVDELGFVPGSTRGQFGKFIADAAKAGGSLASIAENYDKLSKSCLNKKGEPMEKPLFRAHLSDSLKPMKESGLITVLKDGTLKLSKKASK